MHLRSLRLCLAAVCLALLAACGTTGQKAVGPGQYRVVAGDTLTQIARKHGQSVDSLMRMNNLRNPNNIKVGQVLRVGSASSGPAASGSLPDAGSGTVVRGQRQAPAAAVPRTTIGLAWPAEGSAVRSSTGPSPHGVYISNKAGTPVKAVAAGTVVYSGNGLRGYGNLIIVRHASDYISVYAHNRSLAVSEGQSVKQGQKVAEMGSTDINRTVLYFELRYNGKAVDAMRYLPKR
ncbi:peptidoglycan DD-metalloendopeptidase family protein [Paracandidimonas soli]|uniref:peptidoglycan DD-metalloendopeptidase family protein n=1 Tax=Paracandidimonas soli TaxID=1917182 RepID=UPI00104E7F9E|nr:peptidoglycan DD-metalloendopeptidase family protein [Paracandidimonas soli]